jgi:hypothetical protein
MTCGDAIQTVLRQELFVRIPASTHACLKQQQHLPGSEDQHLGTPQTSLEHLTAIIMT